MKNWIRTWVKIDLEEVAKSLLVIGVLNAECFSCHKIGISKESKVCPNCGANFKYVGFRKKIVFAEIERFSERGFILLDFEDFLKEFKRRKAKKIFNSS
ncbi:MAG TPA: hypothetical protein ENI31_06265 [Candidatus Omnitrophica bacterium]|nr:MAG: hypothetical protein DRP61_03440 [Candidatus Omnitrophota bacterium]RKY33231.1 MAG: hypothetical protein DRP69_06495 [Candidatus Omnitrophota bacterium]RKY42411.1 MAG: hypothetical protein DRP80_06855 [Candidatus Omnitrophota bacterium]HEC69868.1 hypothetical protein [Candidatus Omnitrophota bacterium]